MAMNKKEQQQMADLEERARINKALSWPMIEPPPLVPTDDLEYGELRTGWYALGGYISCGPRVQEGCSGKSFHSNSTTKGTGSKGTGKMYHTRLDALLALRLSLAEECAKLLARTDNGS